MQAWNGDCFPIVFLLNLFLLSKLWRYFIYGNYDCQVKKWGQQLFFSLRGIRFLALFEKGSLISSNLSPSSTKKIIFSFLPGSIPSPA
jgi:hypothetical protein